MKNKLDVEAVMNKIRSTEGVTLKPIIDMVALHISKGPFDTEPEKNFIRAEEITAEYIAENFGSMDEFHENLIILDGGVKGMRALAGKIYKNYTTSDHLDFETVKNNISSKKDITLKTITDLVAYKISQSTNDQGVDLNFISAQTFVAEYISKNFRNQKELDNKISKLGKDIEGLSTLADTVYNYYVKKDR